MIVPAHLGTGPSFTVHDLISHEYFQWRIGPNYVRPGAGRAAGAHSAGWLLMPVSERTAR